jgi:hypothetical protein
MLSSIDVQDEHTAALKAVTAELRRQTALAERLYVDRDLSAWSVRRPGLLERIIGRLVALYVICKAL